jgi:hypothetical protein
MGDYGNEYRGVPILNQNFQKMKNYTRYLRNSDSNSNNVNDPLTENDYESNPDRFIGKLSGFIKNLKKQNLTSNYLEKSKKEYKHLSKFMLTNGLYLIQKMSRDSENASKIYGLLLELQKISSNRYPDDIDNFQAAMRKNAVKSRKTRKRKSRKTR